MECKYESFFVKCDEGSLLCRLEFFILLNFLVCVLLSFKFFSFCEWSGIILEFLSEKGLVIFVNYEGLEMGWVMSILIFLIFVICRIVFFEVFFILGYVSGMNSLCEEESEIDWEFLYKEISELFIEDNSDLDKSEKLICIGELVDKS